MKLEILPETLVQASGLFLCLCTGVRKWRFRFLRSTDTLHTEICFSRPTADNGDGSTDLALRSSMQRTACSRRSDVGRRLMGNGGECWPVGRSAVFKIFLLFLRFWDRICQSRRPTISLIRIDCFSMIYNLSIRHVEPSLRQSRSTRCLPWCSLLLEHAGSFQVFPVPQVESVQISPRWCHCFVACSDVA